MSASAQSVTVPGSSSSSESALLTEIPVGLKQLARLVVRGFYQLEEALIIDMLVRYPCLREEDLAELLKFDRKMLRAKMAGLRSDKFIQVKQRMETDEESKVIKMNCYFINYKVFVNIVKYKLDHMLKKMETSERDATNRASFRCGSCAKTFTDLEADQLFDPQTMMFKCTYCSGAVEEDESVGPQKDSRLLLAKFNTQMEKLYDLLRVAEKFRLAPSVLEPEPAYVNLKGGAGDTGGMAGGLAGAAARKDGEGRWADKGSRIGFHEEDQKVNITFGNEENAGASEARREVPVWIAESTVNSISSFEDSLGGNVGASMAPTAEVLEMEGDDDDKPSPVMNDSDEITSLLLRHEKRGGDAKSSQPFIPGASLSDKSDESDDDDDLAYRRKDNSGMHDVASHSTRVEKEDEDEDEGGIPTVRVGDEDITITDITAVEIDRMTTEERERYMQVYQDFYADMYD